VVVGGGISGLCVALQLARSEHSGRLRVRLLDAAPAPCYNADTDIALRVSAMSPGSRSILEATGAWATVEKHRVSAFDHMRVWDEQCEPLGPATLCFDADEFAVPHLGYIVENNLLRYGLLTNLEQTGVELTFGSKLRGIEFSDGRWTLQTDNDGCWVTDLVIAADGGNSLVRETAGIAVQRFPYAQTAFVTHLECALPHQATAWQRFLQSGPLAVLPLADGRVSIVWSTSPEQAETALICSDHELGRMLTAASDRVLGELRVAGLRGSFPLVAQHAQEYVRQGLVLLGDAAHTVHPLAGQGANLGLADATALAAVLERALARGEYPADSRVLRRYERSQRGNNALMLHSFTGLNRLFASDSAFAGELRRAGMRLFSRSGPLRGAVAGVALGASNTR
jgi:2-octaprenylphenol hydroxylase